MDIPCACALVGIVPLPEWCVVVHCMGGADYSTNCNNTSNNDN